MVDDGTVIAFLIVVVVGVLLAVWLGHAWGIWDGYNMRANEELESRERRSEQSW